MLTLLVVTGCGGAPEPIVPRPLPPGETKVRFEVQVAAVPAALRGASLEVEARLYSCPDLPAEVDVRRSVPACLLAFHTARVQITGNRAVVVVPGSKSWTHAHVRLVGIEAVRGRFSPGHNPHWFSGTNRTALTHTFRFRSQENPIPDAVQLELARRFQPLLTVHRDKRYRPSNLEQYHGKTQVVTEAAGPRDPRRIWQAEPKDQHMRLPDPPQVAAGAADKTQEKRARAHPAAHLYYHVRPALTTVSGTQDSALPGFRDDANYWYGPDTGERVVSYWIWYDWNEGPTSYGNVHQGDIESYAVLADRSGRPLRFMATGHDHIMLDTAWTNVNSLNDHPIIYVASGNKGADGGNPISAYGGHVAALDAGNAFFTWLTEPQDVFPDLRRPDSVVIAPEDLQPHQLKAVVIGAGDTATTVDLSAKIAARFVRLVQWEEPGWINQPAVADPDGHHQVDPRVAEFLRFEGRIGRHPDSRTDYGSLTRYGRSPENAPFKTNIEQHYTFERPRTERHYEKGAANYGPRFRGAKPQFVR